ncbi:MAG: hypothetical protein ACFFEX_17325, partial [Candidatus Thorarchaeota archaeon]
KMMAIRALLFTGFPSDFDSSGNTWFYDHRNIDSSTPDLSGNFNATDSSLSSRNAFVSSRTSPRRMIRNPSLFSDGITLDADLWSTSPSTVLQYSTSIERV